MKIHTFPIHTFPTVLLLTPPIAQQYIVAEAHALATGRPDWSASVAFVKEAIEGQHGGAFEHIHYAFDIRGISRALTHEIRIHRYLSFTQAPQPRQESDMAFVAPVGLDQHTVAYDHWHMALGSAVERWKQMVHELVSVNGTSVAAARSMACCVLPPCLATSIMVSGTARAWRKFLIKRGNDRATPEIRRLAIEIAKQLQMADPDVWSDMYVGQTVTFKHGDI